MASVIVPEYIARKMRQDKMLATSGDMFIQSWNLRLQDLDPSLALAFAPEGASGPGIIPGRWHVRKRNDKGADSFFPIVNPDGSFREMDSGIIEKLRRGDHQNDQIVRAKAAEDDAAERSRERAVETAREQRIYELESNLNALTRPSVSMADVRWVNRSAGKRGRKK